MELWPVFSSFLFCTQLNKTAHAHTPLPTHASSIYTYCFFHCLECQFISLLFHSLAISVKREGMRRKPPMVLVCPVTSPAADRHFMLPGKQAALPVRLRVQLDSGSSYIYPQFCSELTMTCTLKCNHRCILAHSLYGYSTNPLPKRGHPSNRTL